MAGLNNIMSMGPEGVPATKRPRIDSLSSETSDIFSRFMDDIDLPDVPDDLIQNATTSSLLNSTDASNSLNSDLSGSSSSQVTQNAQQQPNVPVNAQSSLANSTVQPTQPLSAAPNVNVNTISQQQTPQMQPKLASTQSTSQNQPSMSGSSLTGTSSSTPNTTINMYNAGVNSPRFTSLNSNLNAPSPQPTSISTSADPTPSLPSVSHSPANSTNVSSQSYPQASWGSRSYPSSVPGTGQMMYSTTSSNSSMAPPMNSLGGGMTHMNQQHHQQQAQMHSMGMSQPTAAGMAQGMQPGMRMSQPGMMHGHMQHHGMNPMQVSMMAGASHPRTMVPQHSQMAMHTARMPQPMSHQMAHGQMGMGGQYRSTSIHPSYNTAGMHHMGGGMPAGQHPHMGIGMSAQQMRHPGHPTMMQRGPGIMQMASAARGPSYMSQPGASVGMGQTTNMLTSLDHGPAPNRTPGMTHDINLSSSMATSLSGQSSQLHSQGQPGMTQQGQMHQISQSAQPTQHHQQPGQQHPSLQPQSQVVNQGAPSSQPLPMHGQTTQPQSQVTGQNDLGGYGSTQQQQQVPGAPPSVGSSSGVATNPATPSQQQSVPPAAGGGSAQSVQGTSLADLSSSLDSSQPKTPQQQTTPQNPAQMSQNATPTPPPPSGAAQSLTNPLTPQHQPQTRPGSVPTPPPPGQVGVPRPQQPQVPGQASDPEKRKQIQQQLVLLLHAHKCQRREREQQMGGDFRPCTLPHCKTMKSVLNHMTECQAGRSCTYPHCASSRQIITHWKNCQRPDCPVCLPLKHASLNMPTRRGTDPVAQPGGGPGGMPMTSSHMMNPGSNVIGPSGMGPGNQMQPMMGGAPSQQSGTMPHYNNMAPNAMQRTLNSVGDMRAGGAGNYMNQMSNPSAGMLGSIGQPSAYRLPIPPIVSQPTQPWHSQVNPDLRQHLVRKLVEAIYPVHDPIALQDKRVYSLIQYAMKVEKVMFEAATSREEYYKLLAQKIYLIRKELEDRKRNRNRAPGMVNGDPGGMPQQNFFGGQIHVPSSVPGSQYSLPPTPLSQNTTGQNLPNLGGGGSSNSPRPPASVDMSAGSVANLSDTDSKQDIKHIPNQLISPSPSSGFGSQGPSTTNPLLESGTSLPSLGSVKTEGGVKTEPSTTSPMLDAGPPSSMAQSQAELNSTSGGGGGGTARNMDGDSGMNVDLPGMPSLPEALQHSVPAAPTPSTPPVPSNKPSHVLKRRESVTSYQPSPSSNKPRTPAAMETDPAHVPTPRAPTKSNKVVPDPKLRKVFTGDEIEAALKPVFDWVYYQDPEAMPFRQPVDPKLLGIPDYFEIIKYPMDLSTIDRKLRDGEYKDGWEFCHDMRLMFDNAWLYNRKTSKVYRYCTKLSEVFEANIDQAMQSLGYCCGQKYTFHPQVLYCFGKALCTIPRDSPYYGYQNRYIYCPKCFSEIQGDMVTVGDDPLTQTRIPKTQFKELKNNAIDKEPMVECVHCGRLFHTICVLHYDAIYGNSFQCDNCLRKKGISRKENKFSCRRLPSTKLASFLEERVNNFLRHSTTEAGDVTIRVVSSSDKILEARPLMKERFGSEFPSQFPYKSKAMFFFEDIDGVDVCFFGMHVQEYGSDAQAPNTRRVYISYLDSVHFFRPRHLRTQVYHEILIGYLDFCKNNGYMTAHIWACPPSEGDDYIFHCHPQEQKIPKPKRLVEWYRKMLDRGKSDNVVYDYRDIFKHCTDEGISSVTEIPYFDGDFWPNVIEETIKELNQEAQEREASEQAITDGRAPKKADKRSSKKNGSKKAASNRKATKKGAIQLGGDDLSTKLYQTMEKHRDVFFTVLLCPPPSSTSSPPPGTTDPDQVINCDLMDGRDAFLTMARERHWEFSSLRRAKYSTMAMLYELHTQSGDRFVYNCNHCHLDVETRYHCRECDDFDLCVNCYESVGHCHPMDKLGLGLDDDLQQQDGIKDPKEQRKASVEKCIRFLVHATQCRDPHCKQPSCIKMKRVITHTRECKFMLSSKWNNCTICKQFVLLCISHAKNCTEDKCPVPVCAKIKKNLRDQRNQRNVSQNRFMQHRMAAMARSAAPTNVTNNVASPAQNTSPGNPPSQSPAKGSPATHSVNPPGGGGSGAATKLGSPAGPRSVGKGGPKTPGDAKSRMVASPAPSVVAQNSPAGLAAQQTAKPEPLNSVQAPNVTLGAATGLPDELEIQKVHQNSAPQLQNTYQGTPQHAGMNYMNRQQIPQEIMPHHPNPMTGASTMMYNQHMGGVSQIQPQPNPAMMQQMRMQPSGMSGYPQQHQMMQRTQYHQQYRMQPPVAARVLSGHPQSQVYHQHSSTLHQMLQAPQQQYPTQQSAYAPQMRPHQLGPPPQYPVSAMRHPAPQTAGYPQVLGQSRPMPNHSPMPPQHMHSQYPAAPAMGQMDPSGMQPSNPNFMYQQQTYRLNSSNNNNNTVVNQFSSMSPQERLSAFADNL